MLKLFKAFKDPLVRREYYKYFLVGTLGFIIDFGILAVILYFSKPDYFDRNIINVFFRNLRNSSAGSPSTLTVVIATGLGFLVSYIATYVLSVFFVYRYGNVGKNRKGFLKFMLFGLCGLGISSFGQWLGYDILDLNVWIVKVILWVIVFLFNYVTRKVFIFNINLIIDDEKTIRLPANDKNREMHDGNPSEQSAADNNAPLRAEADKSREQDSNRRESDADKSGD